jgi:hypothetical protein
MGRGRAKAKQTRVARELKYNSPATDLEALQRELSGGNAGSPTAGNGCGDDSCGGEDRAEESYPDEDEVYRR